MKLSVIIPCYNSLKTLHEAINSCYTQGFSEDEFEIVMVDDGSTDKTWQLMQELAENHDNIRIFQHQQNRGGGATRNTAVENARAEFIFPLDSDDMLEEGVLKRMYDYLTLHKLDGVCFEQLISFKGTNRSDIQQKRIYLTDHVYELEDLIERKRPCGLNVVFMFRKSAFTHCGGYSLTHGFDTQGFAWRFLAHGLKAMSCPNTTYYHRVDFHQSYYLREYGSGLTNFNMKNVVLEHDYLLTQEVYTKVQNFNAKDFTQPLSDVLKSMPHVFLTGTHELTQNPPAHLHDLPLEKTSITPASFLGLLLRTRHKLRNKILPSLRSVILKIPGSVAIYLLLRRLLAIPLYIRDLCIFYFKKDKRWKRFILFPVLLEKTTITSFEPHYTYHPAWAARIVAELKPKMHVDISSTLRFCTMVSAFIPVEFYDYRPALLKLDNLISKSADLTNLHFEDDSIDSLSCMHVVEHIGLGRYGDPLDSKGDIKSAQELSRVLSPGGTFIFVAPVGKPKIAFNAHRIYSYAQVIEGLFSTLKLKEFSLVPDDYKTYGLIRNADPSLVELQEWGCGCFVFTK